MKPILFNTEMVRAILEGRKTVTRRVVKFRKGQNPTWSGYAPDGMVLYGSNNIPVVKSPYRPGDILYVRETWYYETFYESNDKPSDLPSGNRSWRYEYKADNPDYPVIPGHWRPSIHMPREAARIFLRVTGIKAQRVQDITDEEARREGCADREDFRRIWNDCYAKPRPVKGEDGKIDHYESYPWEGIHETRIYRGKPWYVIGNLWVWAIESERITKEEAERG